MSKPVYDVHRDIHILNEIPTAVWISNFADGDTRFVWANSEALRLWNKPTLEAFTATDIVSNRSITVRKIHQDLYQDVQVKQF